MRAPTRARRFSQITAQESCVIGDRIPVHGNQGNDAAGLEKSDHGFEERADIFDILNHMVTEHDVKLSPTEQAGQRCEVGFVDMNPLFQADLRSSLRGLFEHLL